MAYQPNPFVNPKQRGVELPPGCKDLMDVLKMEAGEKPRAESKMVSYGVLSEVGKYVGDFLNPEAGAKVLFVGIRGIILMLANRGGILTLNFSVPTKKQAMKDAVWRIFQNPKFGESFPGREYVSVALSPAKGAAAKKLVELLVEGFGVLEGEQLVFCSYARVEGEGEG